MFKTNPATTDLEEAILKAGIANQEEFLRVFQGINRPIYQAFVEDLIALMHKYGIYWNPAGPVRTAEDLKGGKYEVGFDGKHVAFDNDGDLSKANRGKNLPILPLNPPTAHQKMEQIAFRRAILEKARG